MRNSFNKIRRNTLEAISKTKNRMSLLVESNTEEIEGIELNNKIVSMFQALQDYNEAKTNQQMAEEKSNGCLRNNDSNNAKIQANKAREHQDNANAIWKNLQKHAEIISNSIFVLSKGNLTQLLNENPNYRNALIAIVDNNNLNSKNNTQQEDKKLLIKKDLLTEHGLIDINSVIDKATNNNDLKKDSQVFYNSFAARLVLLSENSPAKIKEIAHDETISAIRLLAKNSLITQITSSSISMTKLYLINNLHIASQPNDSKETRTKASERERALNSFLANIDHSKQEAARAFVTKYIYIYTLITSAGNFQSDHKQILQRGQAYNSELEPEKISDFWKSYLELINLTNEIDKFYKLELSKPDAFSTNGLDETAKRYEERILQCYVQMADCYKDKANATDVLLKYIAPVQEKEAFIEKIRNQIKIDNNNKYGIKALNAATKDLNNKFWVEIRLRKADPMPTFYRLNIPFRDSDIAQSILDFLSIEYSPVEFGRKGVVIGTSTAHFLHIQPSSALYDEDLIKNIVADIEKHIAEIKKQPGGEAAIGDASMVTTTQVMQK